MAISKPVLLFTGVPAIPAHIGCDIRQYGTVIILPLLKTHSEVSIADHIGSLRRNDAREPATQRIGAFGLELVSRSHRGRGEMMGGRDGI